MMRKLRYSGLAALLLILYYFIPINYRGLWQPDEFRYAEISREMLINGNWVVPNFFDLRYFEKPIAGYWLNNFCQWLFGANNFGVRAGSVLATLFSSLLIYRLARWIPEFRRGAWITSLVFLTTLLVFGVGSYAVLDPILLFWIVAAMCSYWYATNQCEAKLYYCGFALFGLSCGMGLLTKGFVALAVVGISLLPWIFLQRQWRIIFTYGWLALIIMFAVVFPWGWSIHLQQPDFWHYFFWVEHVQRFAGDNAQHKSPFWYYLPIFLVGALPWAGWLPSALTEAWRQRYQVQSAQFYCLCWVVMPLMLFSFAKGKLLTYILPCYAPLAILIAAHIDQLKGNMTRAWQLNGWINTIFGLGIAIILLTFCNPWFQNSWLLYTLDEWRKWLIAVLVFISWGIMGWLSRLPHRNSWMLSALAPLFLVLAVAGLIPNQIRDNKQPQHFISMITPQVTPQTLIVANHPGVASAVAWELKRSDIWLTETAGELAYGLAYPDNPRPLIEKEQFAAWLAAQRQQHAVALILKLSARESKDLKELPEPNHQMRLGQLVYFGYDSIP